MFSTFYQIHSWIRKKKLSDELSLTSRIIEINTYLTTKVVRRRNTRYQPNTSDVDQYLREEVSKLIKDKEKLKNNGVIKRSKSGEVQSVSKDA